MADPLNFEPTPPPGAGDIDQLLAGQPGLLRALLDQMPARVLVLDEQECIAYANHEFFVFTGLHPKQVLGKHIALVISEETYATYAPARARLRNGEAVCWEGWTVLAGRWHRFMREHLVPVNPSPDRPPRAIVVMSRDLTSLKEREADLQAQVQRLQATEALKSSIVDNALAALVSTDANGAVVEFNPAAERMFGLARADTLGRPVGDLIIPPRHRAAHEAGMARLREGGPARILGRRIEMQALRVDGTEFPIEMVLWRTEVDGVTHYTASMFDLTERLRAQAEIERQRDALRQSEKLTAMGSLLAGVAHELNNPLAIVMGRASLLEAKCNDAELLADATRIREAAERCGRIVRTFLAMARKKPTAHRPVQLNDLARGALDLLSYNLRTGGIEVEHRLAADLPAVLADADQVGQIVLNLLVNAQQGTHPGRSAAARASGHRADCRSRPAPRARLAAGSRQRSRGGAGESQHDFRRVLHDQGGGRRHRSGAGRLTQRCRRAWRRAVARGRVTLWSWRELPTRTGPAAGGRSAEHAGACRSGSG